MFPEANKCPVYSTKNVKFYRHNREDTMTKIIANHIRNINERFIGIPLRYGITIIMAITNM